VDQPLDAAAAHGSMANFLAAGPVADTAEAPVHILAAAVIHMRVSPGLMAFAPPPPALRALARLTHCLARQPGLVPRSFAGLREHLQATTGTDIETLLARLDRVPVTAGPEPDALSFALGAQAPPPGDSVTDALTWASHKPPPEELTHVDGHLRHWQPVIETAATAAGCDPEAQQALLRLLDDYRGMGWAELAGALGAFLTEPRAFTPPSSLPQPNTRSSGTCWTHSWPVTGLDNRMPSPGAPLVVGHGNGLGEQGDEAAGGVIRAQPASPRAMKSTHTRCACSATAGDEYRRSAVRARVRRWRRTPTGSPRRGTRRADGCPRNRAGRHRGVSRRGVDGQTRDERSDVSPDQDQQRDGAPGTACLTPQILRPSRGPALARSRAT
jgi:hypothetical protein